MKMRTLIFLALLLIPATIFAADNTMESLRARFQARHSQIEKLKSAGLIGETVKGYVDFVKDKRADAEATVKEENADREALYKLLADKEGTTPEKVAERNAKRNFEKAKPGEYLQESDGKWRKKA
jgi:uncharacterized protein YdbL (DUF1318 family)